MNKMKTGALLTVGVATWVAAMATGQFIVLLTNIPASSAVVTGFIVPFLLVTGARFIPTHWSISVPFVTYSILAIPTVLLGPPGIHKILVAFIASVVADLIVRVLKHRFLHLSYAIGLALWGLILALMTFLAFTFIELPGKETFLKVFPVLTVIFVTTAFAGAYTATVLFDKFGFAAKPLYRRLNQDQ